jgi:hypothetical protein
VGGRAVADECFWVDGNPLHAKTRRRASRPAAPPACEGLISEAGRRLRSARRPKPEAAAQGRGPIIGTKPGYRYSNAGIL